MIFEKGAVARVLGEFKNIAGAAHDPATVSFKFVTPTGTSTTYVYGTNAQIVRDSLGNFHVDIDCDISGVYQWRWYSTGTGKAALDGTFTVKTTNL